MRRLLSASALAFLLSACIVEAPSSATGAPSAPGAPAAATPRPMAPPVKVESGANFGDVIELTTMLIAPGRASPGDTVRVSAAFKVTGKVPADYMIFVHVEDVDGRTDRLNADHPPARGAVPTSRWEPGQIIRDDFEIMIPPGMPVRGLNLVMGFWDPKTDQRLPVKNADKVKTDGRDRVFVATIPVIPAQ